MQGYGFSLTRKWREGGSRDAVGEEQEKEQKGKLPCQAYLNHHPVSDRSWLVECDTHCAVLFVLFCFTLKKKKYCNCLNSYVPISLTAEISK